MRVPHESIQVTLKTALDCLKPGGELRAHITLSPSALFEDNGRLVTGNGIPQTPKSIPGKAGTGETCVGLLVSTSVWQLKRARSSTSVHGRFTHLYKLIIMPMLLGRRAVKREMRFGAASPC